MAAYLRKTGVAEDIRQAFVVSRYEQIKHFSGLKMLIYGVIVAAVLILLAVSQILFMKDSTHQEITSTYVSFTATLALLGATLFASTTLSSEFEERTALILFTKPIKKSSIFLGKFVTSFMINVVIMALYYIVVAILSLVLSGEVSPRLLESYGYLVMYIFAVTGIAMMFSSLMKRSSSAAVLTFIFLLLGPSLILSVLMIAQGNMNTDDYWYFIDSARSAISYAVLDKSVDAAKVVGTLFVWGIIPTIIAFFRFNRREL
jgi:ABC-2 type transport system permease protein